MQSSTGQYSTQAGDPAQPVQHSMTTASSFGFFLRCGDALGAGLLLQLVGHHSRGFDNLRFGGHGRDYIFDFSVL
jgi:hypothetical protein